jgi:hypothetical protein
MPFSRYGGTVEPADLDLFQRVFDQLCKERRLAKKDKEQREVLAEEIVSLFQKGIMDESELRQTLSKLRKAS